MNPHREAPEGSFAASPAPPPTSHDEALQFAYMNRDSSNLARAYIELHEYVKSSASAGCATAKQLLSE